MGWPVVSRARYEALYADRERIRGERDQFLKDRNAAQEAARTAARRFAEVDEKYTDVCIVNTCLTEDLAKAKERLAQYGVARTVSDVLEEHDVHRKALADALGDQKYHLNWDQLIAETVRMHAACSEWMAEVEDLKTRLARAQADVVSLSGELGEVRETRRPPEGGTSRPRTAATELHLAREQARQLDERIAGLQQSHVADTRKLHDLRQNGGAS